MELTDDGLISSLDIFWKTPPRLPPEWITVDSVLERVTVERSPGWRIAD
jgi:hypothetical protein